MNPGFSIGASELTEGTRPHQTLSLATLRGAYGAFTVYVLTFEYLLPIAHSFNCCIYSILTISSTVYQMYLYLKMWNTYHHQLLLNLHNLVSLCLMSEFFPLYSHWDCTSLLWDPIISCLLHTLIVCHLLSSSFLCPSPAVMSATLCRPFGINPDHYCRHT